MNPNESTQPKPWVLRLLSGIGLRFSDREAYGLGFHWERFLAYCRKQASGLHLATAIAAHKRFLDEQEPRLPSWRLDPVSQALQLFARGIEHWHWERGV